MAKEKRLSVEQDAIATAEQELSTSRYISECTINPGMRAIHDKRCKWLSVIIQLAKKALNNDAVEVVHGQWLEVKDSLDIDRGWKCSNCNNSVYAMTYEPYEYCPHCGSRMDGEDEYV